MSFEPSGDDDDPKGSAPAQNDKVGYGKPPAEFRFKKGQSGNPAGRPRKSGGFRSRGPNKSGDQPAKKYLLEEAYRPVLVREGERTIELPAIQAVFRAMGVSAMKGNRFAQRTLAELVQAVEAENRQAQLDHLQSAINYKCTWDERIEEARERGQPEPQPIPHPDDVFIDFTGGDAKVCGPLTKEAKAEWDMFLGHLDHLQIEISNTAAKFKRSRSETAKAEALHWWKLQQKIFDDLNDNLPKRYRKRLEDRCWEEGASLPGQQRKHLWPNEE
jgi:hypothetical protein